MMQQEREREKQKQVLRETQAMIAPFLLWRMPVRTHEFLDISQVLESLMRTVGETLAESIGLVRLLHELDGSPLLYGVDPQQVADVKRYGEERYIAALLHNAHTVMADATEIRNEVDRVEDALASFHFSNSRKLLFPDILFRPNPSVSVIHEARDILKKRIETLKNNMTPCVSEPQHAQPTERQQSHVETHA